MEELVFLLVVRAQLEQEFLPLEALVLQELVLVLQELVFLLLVVLWMEAPWLHWPLWPHLLIQWLLLPLWLPQLRPRL
jgi:hypothetical protein